MNPNIPNAGNFVAFVSNLRSRRALSEFASAFRQACDFPAETLASPGIVPGVSWSDQLSFWREGYRALMVTDTAFYRYPHYHRPTDTLEKLDYPAMARLVEGLARAILTIAAGDGAGSSARQARQPSPVTDRDARRG